MLAPAIVMTEMFDKTCRTLVVGLGETGLSVARFLSRQGVPVAIVDSREQPPGLERAAHRTAGRCGAVSGRFQCRGLRAGTANRASVPAFPCRNRKLPRAVARQVPVIGDIELFAQTVTAPVIAVTGSNGKSTVVTLLGAMARRAGTGCARRWQYRYAGAGSDQG